MARCSPDELRRKPADVPMLSGVAQQGRELRIGVDCGCSGHTVTEPRRVADGHLEVVVPLRCDRLYDGTEGAGGVRQGNSSGSVGLLAERTAAPDVLRERPDVIDVLEALANRLVAEPLADRLRRMPTVDEKGAGDAEAPLPRWLVVHCYDEDSV